VSNLFHLTFGYQYAQTVIHGRFWQTQLPQQLCACHASRVVSFSLKAPQRQHHYRRRNAMREPFTSSLCQRKNSGF
jgi:hypothetical protein